MTITYEFWLTLETLNVSDQQKITVSFDHDTTMEDLQEYALSEKFDDLKSYFCAYVHDTEDLQDILDAIQENNEFELEQYIDVYCRDLKYFKKFLANKYKNEALKNLLTRITENNKNQEL